MTNQLKKFGVRAGFDSVQMRKKSLFLTFLCAKWETVYVMSREIYFKWQAFIGQKQLTHFI
jgi:hypothetical protein